MKQFERVLIERKLKVETGKVIEAMKLKKQSKDSG